MSRPFAPEHLDKLRSSSLSDDHISALGWSTGSCDRLLIPYLKPDGSPERCHDNRPFLRWRTSNKWRDQQLLKNGRRAPKYLSPAGQGNRLYHSHLAIQEGSYERRLNDRYVALRITEGELKVEAGAAHDPKRVTVGIAGVSSWRDRYDGSDESRPLVDFEELPLQGRQVRLCFDSDYEKPQVAAALRELAEWLADRGAHVLIEVLPNGLDGERLGLDDLIHRHGAEVFHGVSAIARHPFRYRRRNGEEERIWAFNPQPQDTRERNIYLAGMLGAQWRASSDARDAWQRWTGNHWETVAGDDHLAGAVERFMALQGWRNRELYTVRSLLAAFRRSIAPAAEDAAAGLLPFRNGCLRLADRALLPHDPAHDNTWALPYDYDHQATCSGIEAFLADRLGDPASVAVFRAFARALLVGDRLKSFIEITGPSNTGKSVLANLLVALVGSTNTAAGTLQRIEDRAQRFETLKLRGKRLAVFSECQDFAGQLQVLKALTGGDPIGAEIKGGRHLDFTFTGGVVLVGNGAIRATDPTGAVINRRRSLRVEKVVSASAERQLLDPDGNSGWRGELATELPGLVNWCLTMPAAEARAALARDVRSMARAEAELETLLSTDLLADWADQHLIWEPGWPASDALRVGMAGGAPEVFLFPSYMRFVEGQGRNARALSLKTFKGKLIDLLRDTLALPLPPGSVTSGDYRIRGVGSVVPCLRFRRPGEHDANGVIRHAFMARIDTPEAERIEPEAERVGNGKTPVGNGWNGWNGSEQLPHMGENRAQIDPASIPHRATGGAESVPAVPSVPQKGSQRSASVPGHPSSVTQGLPQPFRAPDPWPAPTPVIARTHAEASMAAAGAAVAEGAAVVVHSLSPSPEPSAAMPIAPELAANAGRSNLTTFHPGDWVYIAHSGLPLGRLHRAEVIKAINASVHFDPPILDLLEDPTDPDLGELMLPQPVGSASVHNCFHECGGEAGIRLEESQRDGALWRRLIWQHPDGSTTTREVPPVKIRWQSLDEAGLGEFLAEVAG